jgi:hypothetical protein
LEEALNVAFENECYIFLTSLEKKFMIAGKAVEDLFDPLYNNKTTDKWTHPIQIKKDIADHFFNHLSAETMRIMGEAFQIGEYSKILISYNSIKEELKVIPFQIPLLELLEGVEENLEELSKDKLNSEIGFRDDSGARPGVLNSPNYTTFFGLLNTLEGFFRQSLFSENEITLIFDSAAQYDKAFSYIFETIAKSGPSKLFLNERTTLYFGFKKIKKFDVANSASNVFLQLADLVASTINQLFRKVALNEKPWVVSRIELLFLGLIVTIDEMYYGADLIASSKFKKKLGDLISFNLASIG